METYALYISCFFTTHKDLFATYADPKSVEIH